MEPKIYTSRDHHIRNDLVDPNALTVLSRLHKAGYLAYLVGGSVRDLLMRKRPKDFDIATSALPEQVKKVFRNCILIGRRFRLAHIRFGREIIEVATFRAGEPDNETLIVRDNIWGTPEEDVLRRDFTINGLFYDPLDHRIIDYVGGFEDLNKHCLRSIGNPVVRFKQDPVRMIRMQKFCARFGFNVDKETLEALDTCRREITKSSQARVLEEIFRMLESGSAHPFFLLLHESGLLKILLPTLARYLEKEEVRCAFFTYVKAADELNCRGHYRPLFREVLCAALVFPILQHEIDKEFLSKETFPALGEIIDLTNDLVHQLFGEAFPHFPRKIRWGVQFILHMQYRLVPFDPKKRPRPRMARQKNFQQAITFLKLRALIDHTLFKTYEKWKRIHKQMHETPDG